jgi:hypothetical protein
MFTEKDNKQAREMYQGIVKIIKCYYNNFSIMDFDDFINRISVESNYDDCFRTILLDTRDQIFKIFDLFKKNIAEFIKTDSKDPTDQTVYLAVEALVKAYGLKSPEELLEKVKELTGNSSNGSQSDVNQAFINVNDLITANTVLNSQVESLRAQISALGIKPIV